ncbi:hypothetical protein GALMADRAFT_233506 [Galerina marginata CBS 339.88]|uniref:Nudix hydrolase domain-containing protein n=1 Tax=Galerina marginata (strain CBS 339.88) TaxID=685588 RepID=A0A067TP63_GALM3|nr:hypothetical protein GALMADRAFT_233506 [Galerina marginata CBS 339.88]
MAASSSSSPEIPSSEPLPRFSYKDATQEEVLEDLSSRFILNLPDEELASLERLCFQVEQAHWFYEDFIREENTRLPSLPLKRFSEMLFHACPLLQQWSHDHEQAFNTFMQYKTRVPVCGAIMLNEAMDKCVLVKGWKASAGWGFPRGKINETEPPPTCAIREVLEETGYNLADQLNPKDVLAISIKEQKISLFVVPGVPEDFPFKTKTRKEISKIEWFNLVDLPTWKKGKGAPGRFYLIAPFMGRLKAWINEHRRRNTPRKNGKQKKPQAASRNELANRGHNHIQESSSQSSSVGNAGPHTPSPQQPEPTVSHIPAENVEMDPHFARLLSSLTMSAITSSDNVSNAKSSGDSSVELQPFESPTPSEASTDPGEAPQAPEQPDWSSSAPPLYSPPTDIPPQSNPMHTVEPLQSLTPSHESLRSSVNGSGHFGDTNSSTRIATSPPLPSATSPTSPTSHKSSSTADISPYLARAAEVPTSAKMLQQLSLLEAVADESERMAPIIAARAAMVSRGPITGGYSTPPSSGYPHHLPARDINPNYSYHPGVPSSAAGFHSRYPVENHVNSYQDHFQVRSRTSQAFHRAPMHNSTGSVSINQNHLLASINGARAGPISPNYQIGPQFLHQQQSQIFSAPANPPFYGTPNHAPYQAAPLPMHGYNTFSPNPLPPPPPHTGVRPYSTVNPNIMPGMNIPPPINAPTTTSLSLLSILNGRPSQQTTVPAPAQQ